MDKTQSQHYEATQEESWSDAYRMGRRRWAGLAVVMFVVAATTAASLQTYCDGMFRATSSGEPKSSNQTAIRRLPQSDLAPIKALSLDDDNPIRQGDIDTLDDGNNGDDDDDEDEGRNQDDDDDDDDDDDKQANDDAESSLPVDTLVPTAEPTQAPADNSRRTTTFCVIGDVPYTSGQAVTIRKQIISLSSDCEFLVHVGDLRDSAGSCERSEYKFASEIFQQSPVPVFVLMGDNDWNDCPNPEQGLQYWQSEFIGFENKHWNFPYSVSRLSGHRETFSFLAKGTLFVGLQLVGGDILDDDEWNSRLTDEVNWVKTLIKRYKNSLDRNEAGRVVLFGHANPNRKHERFFGPFKQYVREELDNKLPILYVNGDGHRWKYQPSYFGQQSLLRIMVRGKASEPPLKLTVDGSGSTSDPSEAFVYDRQL